MVQPSRMPQRKQSNRDGPPQRHLLEQDSQDDDHAVNNEEQQDECSTSLLLPSLSDREKRWRERKAKSQEMTEEEMMALALHLSAQEASVSAHRVQQENVSVMKAIKESMYSQRREPSQSQRRLTESDSSCPRRGRSYANGVAESSNNLTASGHVCTDLGQQVGGKGETKQDEEWQRKESPLSDLSQSPDVESALEFLDSPQSGDSTQMDECALRKSPVFAMSGRRASPRLSQNMLESCKTSGYVRCSKLLADSVPSSPQPVLSQSDTAGECAEYLRSPAFGREAPHYGAPHGKAGSPDAANSDLIFSSQESTSARLSSCPPVSPVFPRSPSDKRAYSNNATLSKRRLGSSGGDGKPDRDVPWTGADRRQFPAVADDSSEAELTSDTTLCWSDDDQTLVSSPSPVYPDEKRFQLADAQAAHLKQVTQAGPESNRSGCSLSAQQPVPTQSTVHYYWGVPFCPRGLDPDAYTQVIVAQMDVYEKSLKEAQRRLLRKAQWGDAILPQAQKSPLSDSCHSKLPRRRGLRRKDGKLSSQEVDSLPLETEDEEDEEKKEEEAEEACEERAQTDVDDCVICPETQMSEEGHTDVSKPNSPEFLETAARAEDQAVEEDDIMEVAVLANGETRTKQLGSGAVGRKITNEDEERGSPELEPVGLGAAVECPICQGSFAAGKIERHAAYCNGEAADHRGLADEWSQVSLKTRKRKRWAAEEVGDASSTDKDKLREKCYICKKSVALRDYSEHTDLCIQQRATKTREKGNLLAALEHVESRHAGAGPSSCRLQRGDVMDEKDDEDAGVSMLGVSDSPIKSFTPISEATDCLVHFRRQTRLKKASNKRR